MNGVGESSGKGREHKLESRRERERKRQKRESGRVCENEEKKLLLLLPLRKNEAMNFNGKRWCVCVFEKRHYKVKRAPEVEEGSRSERSEKTRGAAPHLSTLLSCSLAHSPLPLPFPTRISSAPPAPPAPAAPAATSSYCFCI